MEHGHCKDCVSWTRNKIFTKIHWDGSNVYGRKPCTPLFNNGTEIKSVFGRCGSEKFLYIGEEHYLIRGELNYKDNKDLLLMNDHDGHIADFTTGEDFGCVHFEPKEQHGTV